MRFIDANIFVYHMAKDPKYSKKATTIIKRIENGEETATSTLIIAQVLGYLKWRRKQEIIPKFLNFILSLPNLTKTETTIKDLIQAQEISKEHNINWNLCDDLIITAQMQRLNIKEIYTNDTDFDKIPDTKRIFS